MDTPEVCPRVAESPAMVDIRRARKSFRLNNTELRVIRDLSMTVGPGEILGLVGPSGCGKTTLLRIISDLESLDEGTVQVSGMPPRSARELHTMSFVFQRPVLLPWRTVFENVTIVLDVIGRADDQKIIDVLELFGLREFQMAYPEQLSGGMQARVALARAWVADPKLLLLDEPFSTVDALTRWRLNIELLKLVTARGMTAVLVTHSLDEAVLLSDRILILADRPTCVIEEISNPLSRERRQAEPYSSALRACEESIMRALGMFAPGMKKPGEASK